jgi:4-amino-4-deoxy-L-arabinose transferase-like glycosyltransferase/lipid-A-disaccharide synthase-like uncharacterized protein
VNWLPCLAVSLSEKGPWWPKDWAGRCWVLFGLGAQAAFTARFLVQWIASERRGKSYVPVPFWYFSLVGGLMLFTYAAIGKHDLVFSVGQAAGCVVYVRNLMLLRREKALLASEGGDLSLPADRWGPRMVRELAVIVGLCALLTASSFLSRDLWNPDEPRYTEVAREMAVSGQYLVPHLNGLVYPEKPPLFFWVAAALWKAGFGVESGKVLAALSALAVLVAVYLLVRRFMPGVSPLLVAAVTLSMLFFGLYARIGVIDPFFSALAVGATALGYVALHRGSPHPKLCWLGVYLLAALGVLTKGPVGFIIPAVVLVVYGLLARRRVAAGGWVHLAGAAIFAAVVLAWLLPAIARGGPEYRQIILFKQNLGRAVSSWSHRNPFYYYVVLLPALYFPWSVLLPLAAVKAWKERQSDDSQPALFALSWLVAVVAFFSLMSGKRIGYILPTVPAVGVLVGWYLSAARPDGQAWRKADAWLLGIALGLCAFAAGLLMVASLLSRTLAGWAGLEPDLVAEIRACLTAGRLALGLALFSVPLLCSLAGLFSLSRAPRRTVPLMVATMLTLFAAVDIAVVPVLNHTKSAKLFCLTVQPYLEQATDLRFYDVDFAGEYNLYSGRVSIPVIEKPGQLRPYLAVPGNLTLSDEKRFQDVLTAPELKALTLVRRSVGHRTMMLLGTLPAQGHPAGAGEPPAAR